MATSESDPLVGAAGRWRLKVGRSLAGGTGSLVYAVRDELDRELVLKLPVGRSDAATVTAAEAAALTSWADSGVTPRLAEADGRALLMQRARPGTVMAPVSEDSLTSTVEIAAEILGRLWAVVPGPYPFQSLAEAYADAERVARADAAHEQRRRADPQLGRPGLMLLPTASTAAESLIVSAGSGELRLLHGDFLSKNLLRHASSPAGYIAVDPLPQLGERAAEVAAFAAYQPAAMITPTAEALAARLGLDQDRVLRWTAIWTVHQAVQCWRDDQAELEGLVQAALKQLLV